MWLEVARWLDSYTILYWGPGFTFLLLSAYLSMRPLEFTSGGRKHGATRAGNFWFLFSLVLCLFAFRWPTFLYFHHLTPDESQLIVNARKFMVAPIPWLDVDTTTSGPLNSYILILPALFGMSIDYLAVRIIGVLLLSCLLVFSYLTIRTLCSGSAARVAVLPTLALLGVMQSHFIDFSTEFLPIALLAGSTYVFARAARGKASPHGIYITGLCLGAVPLAKLQAGPLAVLIFGYALFGFWKVIRFDGPHRLSGSSLRKNWRVLYFWLIAGGATVPLVFFVMLVLSDTLTDAWRSYILTPVFLGSEPFSPGVFFSFLFRYRGFNVYLITMALLCLVPAAIARWYRHGTPNRQNDSLILATAIYGLTVVYVIWKGANPWDHYLLYLLHPVILMTGLIWHRAIGIFEVPDWLCAKATHVAVSVLLVVWALVFQREWGVLEGRLFKSMQMPTDPVSQLIIPLARDDVHFAIWGYMAQYYVKTGLHPSTRDVMTQFQIQTNPLKAYYIERYLKDFQAAQPMVFVEAVGEGNFNQFWDADAPYSRAPEFDVDASYEVVPELARIIREDFILVYDIAHCGTPETRIYVHKSRFEELGSSLILPKEKKLCLASPE